MEWLAAKSLLGLPRWGLGLAIAALLAGAVLLGNHFVDRAFDDAGEAGAAQAVNAGHEITLDQVGKANAAGNKVRDDRDDARYAQCVRDSDPEFAGNCERWRPVEPVPDRP